MRERRTLPRETLERIVQELSETNGVIPKITRILSQHDPQLLGDSVEVAMENYRDRLDDFMSTVGYRDILNPKVHLDRIVRDIEQFSEIVVEGVRLFSYYLLIELDQIARSPLFISEYPQIAHLIQDAANRHGGKYQIDDVNGVIYAVNQKGERQEINLMDLLSPAHEKEPNFETLIARVNSLTELLNVLQIATDEELVAKAETTIPRARLHASFDAFYDALKQIKEIQHHYYLFLRHLKITNPEKSVALDILKHARIPYSTRIAQRYRELIVEHAREIRYAKGGILGTSLVVTSLGIPLVPVLAVGMGIFNFLITDYFGGKAVAKYRSWAHSFQIVEEDAAAARNHPHEVKFASKYLEGIVQVSEYMDTTTRQEAPDAEGMKHRYTTAQWEEAAIKLLRFSPDEAKEIYSLLSHSYKSMPSEIRERMKHTFSDIITRHPTRVSFVAACYEIGALNLDELHEAARDGFTLLMGSIDETARPDLLTKYAILANKASDGKLYKLEELKFDNHEGLKGRIANALASIRQIRIPNPFSFYT